MIKESSIKTGVIANSWEEAIVESGRLLEEAGSCTSAYTEAMVQSVKDLGPYIVITPHVALAHARPSETVKENDISLTVLKEPVMFNHKDNDPVSLVFAFCAKDNDGHLEQLTKLAGPLSDTQTVAALSKATNADEVLQLLK